MRPSWTVLQTLAAGLTVAGCAHRAAQPPEVVHTFAGAVASGDWPGAYALMSTSYRDRVSLAKFRADLQAETLTVSADAADLARAGLRGVHCEGETTEGRRLHFVLEAGGWRLQDHPLTPFAQDSPRAALRTFIRAVDQRRYDVLLRLVPARRRAGVTVDALRAYWEGAATMSHRRVLEQLRAAAAAERPIVDLGTEALMPFGEAPPDGPPGDAEGEVHFLLEDGLWKIDDLR